MLRQLEQRPDDDGPNCQKINNSSLTTATASATTLTIHHGNDRLGNADIHPPPPDVNELEDGCSENTIAQHRQHVKGGGFQEVNVEGQTFRVLMSMDPIHVQQWRRDRCKNWPSKENLRRKAQELEQRERSGALTTNMEQCKKPPLQQKHGGRQLKHPKCQITEAATAETPSSPKEDGESVVASCASMPQQKTLVVNEDEIEEATSKKNGGPSSGHPRWPQLCKRFAKGICKRGDACQFQHDGVKVRQRKRRNLVQTTVTPHTKGESSLLRALLQKEVWQEANVLLQCIRYLVKNFIPPGGAAAEATLQQ